MGTKLTQKRAVPSASRVRTRAAEQIKAKCLPPSARRARWARFPSRGRRFAQPALQASSSPSTGSLAALAATGTGRCDATRRDATQCGAVRFGAQFGRCLPRAARPVCMPFLPTEHSAIPRSFRRSEPKLVPMQGRSVSRICDSDLLGAWQRPSFAGYYSPEGKAGEVRALLAASRTFEC